MNKDVTRHVRDRRDRHGTPCAPARGLSKGHAAGREGPQPPPDSGFLPGRRAFCLTFAAGCAIAVQGFPSARAAGVEQPRTAAPALAWQALAEDVWLLPAAPAEPGPANRGHVTQLVLARDAGRLWLVGAGPTPAFARALEADLRRRFGRPADEVLVPWARGEQALGATGHGRARLWAHADVVAAMRRQCPTCLANLRQQLGPAAVDLGPRPIRLPDHRLRGDEGDWGPWRWHRVERGPGQVVTVLVHRRAALAVAPALLGEGGPPEGRAADLSRLAERTAALATLPGVSAETRWVGEQGGVLGPDAPARHAAYWRALVDGVDAAYARGELPGTEVPMPGVDPAWLAHPRHTLNVQRAWRAAEDRDLTPAAR